MRSLTQQKKGMVGGLAAIVLSGSLFLGQSNAATVIAGGTVPLVNTLIATSVTSLDPTADGVAVVVASFYITNNAPNAFSLVIDLAGGGGFYPLDGAITDDGIDWTATTLIASADQPGDSHLGATAALPATATIAALTPGVALATAVDWDATAQTDGTLNYKVDLTASWTGVSTLLAGMYTETITATLTAQL